MEINMNISGHTKMICLLGSPVAHSLSPAMHNEGFKQLDLDYCYLAFDVKEGELKGVLDSFKKMGVRGFNLTMPLKTEAVALCDKLSPAAKIAESVNTVVIENDGTVTGHTTDGIGFTESARQAGVDYIGKKITLLGTGGAGIAVLTQLALDGAGEISVFERAGSRFKDRTASTIRKIHESTSCKVTVYDYEDNVMKREISESVLLINATNVGMAPNPEGNLIKDTSWLTDRATGMNEKLTVSDVIYNPRKTKLLEMAEECGLNAFNGMYMLLYQGAAAFELWTGKKMPVEIVKEKYFDI